MNQLRSTKKRGLIAQSWVGVVAALLPAASSQAAFVIAEDPLFLSTSVSPNVMLQVDNSGSMDTLVWASGYDPDVSYEHWGNGYQSEGNTFGRWGANQTNVGASSLVYCSGNRIYGRYIAPDNSQTAACINVPRPEGSSTRYDGNYLNYLFETYAVAGQSIAQPGNAVPGDTRLDIARDVAVQLVGQNTNLRFGLAVFNPPRSGSSGPGGRIVASCSTRNASQLSSLQSTINGLTAEANTPLAETYYEVTRYFRGLNSAYNTNSSGHAISYTSPQQYRCQKNFVIVITDGFPTYDTGFPTGGDTDPTASNIPNYDGLAPATTTADFPNNFPPNSDGFQPAGDEANEGYALYLDDLAEFGYQLDVKTSGTDITGGSYENANGETFDPQNLITYTVGIALDNQMLIDAANNGDGLFFRADNQQQLLDSLNAAVSDILDKTSSAASVATNSTRLSADTLLFQARFSSGDWSGNLVARSINSDGTVGSVAWEAKDGIPAHDARSIYTMNDSSNAAVAFEYANLSSAQQALLDVDANGATDSLGSTRVALLRGDTTASSDPKFRIRTTALGDIINSDPAFLGEQDFGFRRLPGTEGSSYPSFVAGKSSRTDMVFVGANDGMLHGFRASDGVETFAYVPTDVMGRIGRIVDSGYVNRHRYTVDGTVRTIDAYWGSSWRSIIIGSTGAGGRSVFAIDATDPTTMGASSVLWEYNSSDSSELGKTIPIVTAARMANGDWAAIVGNGYNSQSERAQLFIINLRTGALIRRIDTGVGSSSAPNGLSSPIPVDVDNDKVTDHIYAGDLLGNVWKFDVQDSTAANWEVAFSSGGSPAPLFTACEADPCTSTNRQPITARPEVGLNPNGGVIVYVGTGKYFETSDATVNANEPTQSFYGLFDKGSRLGGRNDLLEQEVIAEINDASLGGNVRVTSDNPLTGADEGWFIDLPANGERQVSTPLLRPGRVVFTTLIPEADPCGFGGTSFIMELDAVTGGRLSVSPFDLNGDNVFDSGDLAEITVDGNPYPVIVSGKESDVGIIKTPGVLTPESGVTPAGFEFKYASGSSGAIEQIRESNSSPRGRMSWRQIQ